MPIYEYKCQTCGEEFEEIQKFSEPALTKHSCSPKSVVNRKVSLNAFQLKGGGWYNEGYSSGNGAAAEKGANGGNEAKSESASKDKSDSGSDKGAKSESVAKDKSGSGSDKKAAANASSTPSTPKSSGASQAPG